MPSWLRIVENGSARLFAALVQAAVLVACGRTLGPAGQGLLVTATTWAALFATFAGLSLGPISHQRVRERQGDDWLAGLAGTMLVFAIGSSLVAYAVMLIGTRVGSGGLFRDVPALVIALAGLSLPLLVLEEYGRNLLAAAGKLRSYAIAQLAGGALRLVLVIAALGPLGLGVEGVLIGLAIGQAVTVAIQCHALWIAAGGRLRPNLAQARALLGGSVRLHANTVASFLLGQANVLLLNQFASKQEVGWYQLAFQFIGVLLLLPQAAAMVLYAKIAELGPDRVWPFQKRLLWQVMLAVMAIGALAAMIAPWLLVAIAGPSFAPAAGIFRWLLVVLVATSAAELMAPQWYARGAFLTATVLTCACAGVNIALNAVLIPEHGVMGAVFGTVACYLVFVVLGQLGFGLWCESRYARARASSA